MAGLASVRYHPGISLAVHEPLTLATAKQIPSQQINEIQRIRFSMSLKRRDST
jgi:hypothetical protein